MQPMCRIRTFAEHLLRGPCAPKPPEFNDNQPLARTRARGIPVERASSRPPPPASHLPLSIWERRGLCDHPASMTPHVAPCLHVSTAPGMTQDDRAGLA